MFSAAVFVIAKKEKQPKCSSTGKCINKVWQRHAMEYYSATQRNEMLIHVLTWKN